MVNQHLMRQRDERRTSSNKLALAQLASQSSQVHLTSRSASLSVLLISSACGGAWTPGASRVEVWRSIVGAGPVVFIDPDAWPWLSAAPARGH